MGPNFWQILNKKGQKGAELKKIVSSKRYYYFHTQTDKIVVFLSTNSFKKLNFPGDRIYFLSGRELFLLTGRKVLQRVRNTD